MTEVSGNTAKGRRVQCHFETVAVGDSVCCTSTHEGVGQLLVDRRKSGPPSKSSKQTVIATIRCIRMLLERNSDIKLITSSNGHAIGVLNCRQPCPSECEEALVVIRSFSKVRYELDFNAALAEECTTILQNSGIVAWEDWTLFERLWLKSIADIHGLEFISRLCDRPLRSVLEVRREEIRLLQTHSVRQSDEGYVSDETLLHSREFSTEANKTSDSTFQAA
jgi:hypothetical protein